MSIKVRKVNSISSTDIVWESPFTSDEYQGVFMVQVDEQPIIIIHENEISSNISMLKIRIVTLKSVVKVWDYFIHSREEKRYLIHILENDFFGVVFLRIIGFKKIVKIPKYVRQKNKILGMYIYEKKL